MGRLEIAGRLQQTLVTESEPSCPIKTVELTSAKDDSNGSNGSQVIEL